MMPLRDHPVVRYHRDMVGKEKYLLIVLGVLLVTSLALVTLDVEMETAVDIARAVCVALAIFFLVLILAVRTKLKRMERDDRSGD